MSSSSSSSSSAYHPRPSVGSTPRTGRLSQGVSRASRISIGPPANLTNTTNHAYSSYSEYTPRNNLAPSNPSNMMTTPRYPTLNTSRHALMTPYAQDEKPSEQDSEMADPIDQFRIAPQSTVLPEGSDFNPPSLQFQQWNGMLEQFMLDFSYRTRELSNQWSQSKDMFRDRKVENELKAKKLLEEKSRIEKDIDREWEAIKHEQAADTARRQKLSVLNSNHGSLKERSNELQSELSEAKRILEEKIKEKELEKKNYQNQIERNLPELKALEELTGCKIRGTKKNDETSFIFSLVNSENYSEQSYLNLVLGERNYVISSHSGHLKEDRLKEWLDILNKDRNVFVFLKRVRDALRREFDSRRAEKGRQRG